MTWNVSCRVSTSYHAGRCKDCPRAGVPSEVRQMRDELLERHDEDGKRTVARRAGMTVESRRRSDTPEASLAARRSRHGGVR